MLMAEVYAVEGMLWVWSLCCIALAMSWVVFSVLVKANILGPEPEMPKDKAPLLRASCFISAKCGIRGAR